jgi:hypothetical protein
MIVGTKKGIPSFSVKYATIQTRVGVSQIQASSRQLLPRQPSAPPIRDRRSRLSLTQVAKKHVISRASICRITKS